MKLNALVLLVFLSGCATTNFDPSKPITDGGATYKQNGEIIDRGDLIKKLKDHPKTKDDAQSADTLQKVSIGPSIAGGLLLGFAIGSPSPKTAQNNSPAQSGLSDSDRSALLVGGGALIVGALIINAISSKHLADAVSTHNSSLQGTSSSRVDVTPFIGYAASGAVCGFKLDL